MNDTKVLVCCKGMINVEEKEEFIEISREVGEVEEELLMMWVWLRSEVVSCMVKTAGFGF
nr:hypothetical protein [Bacillus sp. WP8]